MKSKSEEAIENVAWARYNRMLQSGMAENIAAQKIANYISGVMKRHQLKSGYLLGLIEGFTAVL